MFILYYSTDEKHIGLHKVLIPYKIKVLYSFALWCFSVSVMYDIVCNNDQCLYEYNKNIARKIRFKCINHLLNHNPIVQNKTYTTSKIEMFSSFLWLDSSLQLVIVCDADVATLP